MCATGLVEPYRTRGSGAQPARVPLGLRTCASARAWRTTVVHCGVNCWCGPWARVLYKIYRPCLGIAPGRDRFRGIWKRPPSPTRPSLCTTQRWQTPTHIRRCEPLKGQCAAKSSRSLPKPHSLELRRRALCCSKAAARYCCNVRQT